MKYFKELNFQAFPKMLPELYTLINNGTLEWGSHNQVCLNSTQEKPTDYKLGTASLDYDWDNKEIIVENGITRIVVPKKAVPLKDSDFTILCDQFKNTVFEDVYNMLSNNFKIGRIRLMRLEPKTCLSWHVDHTARIHYPLTTQEGCHMVIDNEVIHLPQDTWWTTDTTKLHTAFNASKESRIHLVACLVD